MARWHLTFEPDSRYEYHSTSAHWVLAEIVERVTGIDHRTFFADEVADPLGIALRLGAPEGDQASVKRLVAIGDPPTQEQLDALGIPHWDPGEVVNDNLVILNDPANMALCVPGGGGIATAADLALFYQGVLHNHDELWDPEVLELATSTVLCDHPDPLTGVPAHRTLGLSIAGADGKAAMRGFGHTCGPRTFGHLGAGGQIAWVDPDTGLSFAYLTNGLDAFVPNQWRRVAGLASRAAACAT
jgi:CubicO group peptidase (beta-lactamase class C family)